MFFKASHTKKQEKVTNQQTKILWCIRIYFCGFISDNTTEFSVNCVQKSIENNKLSLTAMEECALSPQLCCIVDLFTTFPKT